MTQTTSIQEDTPNDDAAANYRCPFCRSTYSDERLARAHITWADDDIHRNHSGFMPETKIEVLDSDGNVIEDRTRRPEELKTNDIPLEAFPPELSESKQRVCRIVAYNPNIDSYAEIHERSEAVLTENGLDTVGYNTVRRWIQEFYMPHTDPTESEDDQQIERNDELLDELTEKQRAVITEHLENPELSTGELAARADVSRSYPSQILDKFEELINTLQDSDEQEYSDSNTVGNSVDDDESGGEPSQQTDTSDVDTDWSDANSVSVIDEPIQPVSADDDHSDSERSIDTDGDGPVTGPATAVMSASPPDLLSDASQPETHDDEETNAEDDSSSGPDDSLDEDQTADSGSLVTSTTEERSEEETDEPDAADPSDSTKATGTTKDADYETSNRSEMIAPEEIVEVLDRIQFQRRVAERELEAADSSRAASQLAILAELEMELQQLLK